MLKIKEMRENKKLSQDDMVRLTGIPKRSYINYEKETTDVPLKKLQKIAIALQVEVQDLIRGKEPKMVKEPGGVYEIEKETTLLAVRDDIKNDLREMTAGFMKNFETLSNGVLRSLNGQQKILRFIDKLEAAEIAKAGERLDKFLKEHKY